MILKLAILTCVFYLAIVVLVELVALLLTRLKGSFVLWGSQWAWAVFFAFIWLASYSLAWHILCARLRRQ